MNPEERGLAPLRPTTTDGVAAGLAEALDRGTAERGLTVPASAGPATEESVVARGRRFAGDGDSDRELLDWLLELLQASTGVLPLPLRFGAEGWLRLLRYLLSRGDQASAQNLFARAGTAARDWVREIVDRYWPVGVGFAVDAAIGATFGYPLQLTAETSFSFERSSPTRFTLKRKGLVDGGFDTGIGAGAFLSLGTARLGRGVARQTARQGIGANAAAQAQASLVLSAEEEFEFPVFEDPGFLPLLVFLADVEDEVRLAAIFENSLRTLLPDPYRKKLKLTAKVAVRGAASAEAGVRTRGKRTGERIEHPETGRKVRPGARTFKAKRTVGKTEDSRREFIFFDDYQQGWRKLLNFRAVVQDILRAGLSGAIEIEAGGGLVIEPVYARDAAGLPTLGLVRLQLFGEGATAVSLAVNLPLLAGLLPSLGLDVGVGLRVNLEARPPFSTETLSLVGHEVYVRSGDLNADDGPAHETSMQLPGLDPATYRSLAAFIAAIEASRMIHRIGIGSTIGRNYATVLARFKSFTTMLSPGYRQTGFHVVGLITFQFLVPGEIARRLIGRIGDVLLAAVEEDPEVKALVAKATEALGNGDVLPELPEAAERAARSLFGRAVGMLRDFWETGAIPPEVEALAGDLVRIVIDGLAKVTIHGEVGYGIAGEVQAAKGAKARIHGAVSGRVTFDRNVLPMLKQDLAEVLRPEELLDLLRGAFDDAAELLDMHPDQIPAPRPGL